MSRLQLICIVILTLLIIAIGVPWLSRSGGSNRQSGPTLFQDPSAPVSSPTGGIPQVTTGEDDPSVALERLASLLQERNDYQVYVALRGDEGRWNKVFDLQEEVLVLQESSIRLERVCSFIVAYGNGEILESWRPFSPLPMGLHYAEAPTTIRHDVLDPKELAEGERFIRVTFGPAVARKDEPDRYSTTLKNLSDERIRVRRFGAFVRFRSEYVLSTVSGDYFTEEQFREWYGVNRDGWIKPGQSVTDGNNYGGGDGYWVYDCETESGRIFRAGERIPSSDN